jgi:hypothetical protein
MVGVPNTSATSLCFVDVLENKLKQFENSISSDNYATECLLVPFGFLFLQLGIN